MRLRRAITLAVIAISCAYLAPACTCSNSTPIQRTFGNYGEHAVFTARVIQFMGDVWTSNGKRFSGKALAVVEHRYWGLPWYWPKVVLLDGGTLCGMALGEGEYLVSGYRMRYGVLDVGSCSRTQPLTTAQVDLRTLDGSRCTGPGGALIGRVLRGTSDDRETPAPVADLELKFQDALGKTYMARSDAEGVFELTHLPPGPYTAESRLSAGSYVAGYGEVRTGVCLGGPVRLSQYSLTGRLIPGMRRFARVDLVRAPQDSPGGQGADITADGRFYFASVPAGDYYLVASINLDGMNTRTKVYYPGSSNPEKARLVHVSSESRNESFDFNPDALPVVRIPIFVVSPDPPNPILVEIRSQTAGGMTVEDFRSTTGIPVFVLGVRGESYRLSAYARNDQQQDSSQLHSEMIQVTAKSGMKTTALSLVPSTP